MRNFIISILLFVCFLVSPIFALAQNPLIMDQFTADPSARVFEGKVYVYPSHDIKATPKHGRVGWFCMKDYHVFSSENLTDCPYKATGYQSSKTALNMYTINLAFDLRETNFKVNSVCPGFTSTDINNH